MKLSTLYEDGHWRPISGYPGSLVKKKKKKGEKRRREMSFLTHPEDRGKFVRWGKKKVKK